MTIFRIILALVLFTITPLFTTVFAWGGGGAPAGCKDEGNIRYCNTITYHVSSTEYGPNTGSTSTTSKSGYYYYMYTEIQLRHNSTLKCNDYDEKTGSTQGVFASCTSTVRPTGWTSTGRHKWKLNSTSSTTTRDTSARY